MKKSQEPPPRENAALKLTVTVSKTADGKQDYLQVMSGDSFSVNVVLIADKIVVEDRR